MDAGNHWVLAIRLHKRGARAAREATRPRSGRRRLASRLSRPHTSVYLYIHSLPRNWLLPIERKTSKVRMSGARGTSEVNCKRGQGQFLGSHPCCTRPHTFTDPHMHGSVDPYSWTAMHPYLPTHYLPTYIFIYIHTSMQTCNLHVTRNTHIQCVVHMPYAHGYAYIMHMHMHMHCLCICTGTCCMHMHTHVHTCWIHTLAHLWPYDMIIYVDIGYEHIKVSPLFAIHAFGVFTSNRLALSFQPRLASAYPLSQDSSKGGAVETGCSDLYALMHYFVIWYSPNPLHPPPTAPPCNEYPLRADSDSSPWHRSSSSGLT